MDKKYLPIGTVVELNNSSRPIMIIGYYSVEYQNVAKIFDYVGCVYPEGILLKNQVSFNHSDIKSVIALGYKDDKYEVLNKNLNGQLSNVDAVKGSNSFVNVKFDKNGVVVYDEVASVKEVPEIITNRAEVTNPFRGEVKEENAKSVAPKYVFDENGTVIADGAAAANAKEIENNFVFDENGTVVADNSAVSNGNNTVAYTFSKDGFVTDESPLEMPELKSGKTTGQYKFDANGTVIAE